MSRRSASSRVLHTTRPVSTRRPMHLTTRVHADVPGLRRDDVLRLFRRLFAEAAERGVRTVAFAVMHNHVHWLCVPASRDALRDATRYLFGVGARRLNALFGRSGPVFVDRFWSGCCQSVRQAFAALGYILKNGVTAGYRNFVGGLDRYSGIDEDTLAADPFLRSVVGPTPRTRRDLIGKMARGPLPFVPLAERLQPALPGL